jgi:hypothetical protein
MLGNGIVGLLRLLAPDNYLEHEKALWIFLDRSWIAHGLLMDCSWIAHGLLMDCSWIAHGLLMDCSWIAPGLLIDLQKYRINHSGF